MSAVDLKNLFKNDFKECEEVKDRILKLLEKEDAQKKAAKIITKLLTKKSFK